MDLILWRHAEAEEESPDDDDLARRLTPKGERNARRVAEWLNRFLPSTTRVLVSPAVRCQQTADALGRKFKTTAGLGPQASVDALLAAVRWPDSREPVLVVGHQPTLGFVAAYLMTGAQLVADPQPGGVDDGDEDGLGPLGLALQSWSIKKGSVWWLRYRPREDRGEVVLVAVRSPEQL